MSALIASVAPADLRGTAFGVFNFACGHDFLIAYSCEGRGTTSSRLRRSTGSPD